MRTEEKSTLANVPPGYGGPKFKLTWLWPWALGIAAIAAIAVALWWMFGH